VTASVTITSDKKLIFDERGLRAVIIEKLDVAKKKRKPTPSMGGRP